jgi:hypothetical protein
MYFIVVFLAIILFFVFLCVFASISLPPPPFNQTHANVYSIYIASIQINVIMTGIITLSLILQSVAGSTLIPSQQRILLSTTKCALILNSRRQTEKQANKNSKTKSERRSQCIDDN